MTKTEKKIESAICESLTEVCEIALDEVAGFKWLTHQVNYHDFPRSLVVVCVFDTNEELASAQNSHHDEYLCQLIQNKLSAIGIPVKDIRQRVNFDTEEACQSKHGGNWDERLRSGASRLKLR